MRGSPREKGLVRASVIESKLSGNATFQSGSGGEPDQVYGAPHAGERPYQRHWFKNTYGGHGRMFPGQSSTATDGGARFRGANPYPYETGKNTGDSN